jgi:hypothetical protein
MGSEGPVTPQGMKTQTFSAAKKWVGENWQDAPTDNHVGLFWMDL